MVVVVCDPDAVLEPGAVEHVGDEVVAVEPPLSFLSGGEQLVGHRERRGLRAGAFRDACAQPDGGEGAFDRVRGPQVPPVLGREVVERGQLRPVAVELASAFGYFAPYSSRNTSSASLASLRVGASMISESSPFARDCSRLGRQSITFPEA